MLTKLSILIFSSVTILFESSGAAKTQTLWDLVKKWQKKKRAVFCLFVFCFWPSGVYYSGLVILSKDFADIGMASLNTFTSPHTSTLWHSISGLEFIDRILSSSHQKYGLVEEKRVLKCIEPEASLQKIINLVLNVRKKIEKIFPKS